MDLEQRLIDCATEAIRNERPALEHKPRNIQSVTIELHVNKFGQIVEGVAFVGRRHDFKPPKDLVS